MQLEVVTGLRRGAAAPRVDRQRRVVGTEPVRMRRAAYIGRPWPLNSTTPSPPTSRSTRASRRSPTSSGVVPAVEGGSVTEVVEPGQGQGRDPHADGRDVDEADRHGRGGRAGRRPRTARCCACTSRESGGTGHANADVTFQLKDGGGDDPHQRADHRQGRVDGRGRGGRRARRADHGLHDQARPDLRTPMARVVDAGGQRGRGAARRRHGAPGGPGPPGVPRQRARRLRLRAVRQRARRVDGRGADDVQGARAAAGSARRSTSRRPTSTTQAA